MPSIHRVNFPVSTEIYADITAKAAALRITVNQCARIILLYGLHYGVADLRWEMEMDKYKRSQKSRARAALLRKQEEPQPIDFGGGMIPELPPLDWSKVFQNP